MQWFFIVMAGIVLFSTFSSCESDKNLKKLPHCNGNMTKLEYAGHNYIGWSCNLGASLVHDPDCQCFKKEILGLTKTERK